MRLASPDGRRSGFGSPEARGEVDPPTALRARLVGPLADPAALETGDGLLPGVADVSVRRRARFGWEHERCAGRAYPKRRATSREKMRRWRCLPSPLATACTSVASTSSSDAVRQHRRRTSCRAPATNAKTPSESPAARSMNHSGSGTGRLLAVPPAAAARAASASGASSSRARQLGLDSTCAAACGADAGSSTSSINDIGALSPRRRPILMMRV